MGELVDLRAERAMRELAALVERRPDIGAAVQAAAEGDGMARVENRCDGCDHLDHPGKFCHIADCRCEHPHHPPPAMARRPWSDDHGKVELDFLTVEEAAAALRVKVATIRAWILRGKLPAYHVGRRVILRRADVAAMVKPLVPGQGGGDA